MPRSPVHLQRSLVGASEFNSDKRRRRRRRRLVVVALLPLFSRSWITPEEPSGKWLFRIAKSTCALYIESSALLIFALSPTAVMVKRSKGACRFWIVSTLSLSESAKLTWQTATVLRRLASLRGALSS